MKGNNLLIVILVGVIALGIGAFAGIQYQKSQRPSFGNGRFAGRFGGGQGGAGGRFGNGANRPVIGQVVSVDPTGITVKLSDGSTKIVVIGSSTMINKTAAASKGDLATRTNVAVFGTTNSDGSVTAQNVSINPQMMRRPSTTPAPTK